MRDQPRQVLCGLIARYGHALADDRDRCSGLLRDLCPADKPEIKVLLTAQDEGIAAALAGASQASVPDALVARLTKRLRDDCHMTDEAARWAVESWALALGVIAAPVAPMPTPVPTPPTPTPTPTPAPTPIPTPAPGSGGVRVGAGAMALLLAALVIAGVAVKSSLDQAERQRQQAEQRAEQARRDRQAEIDQAKLQAEQAGKAAEFARQEAEWATRLQREQAERERLRKKLEDPSIARQASPELPKPRHSLPKGQTSVWKSDWGNSILAAATTMACPDTEFSGEGYGYALFVSIPVARLKQDADAWHQANGRAITVIGCWFTKTDGLAHAKMRRKKDGKIWEQDLNFADGSWSGPEKL